MGKTEVYLDKYATPHDQISLYKPIPKRQNIIQQLISCITLKIERKKNACRFISNKETHLKC